MLLSLVEPRGAVPIPAVPPLITAKSCRRRNAPAFSFNGHLRSDNFKEDANPPFLVKMYKATKGLSKWS
jgi:hypothetical protein